MTSTGRSRVAAWVACAITMGACGGGTPASTPPVLPTATPTRVVIGPVDPALVGSWTGTINGSLGLQAYTMTLETDASMSALGAGAYCRMAGTWGVSGGQFAARGQECQGFVVTLVAPASPSHLSGTWTASGGARGQFTIARQVTP